MKEGFSATFFLNSLNWEGFPLRKCDSLFKEGFPLQELLSFSNFYEIPSILEGFPLFFEGITLILEGFTLKEGNQGSGNTL